MAYHIYISGTDIAYWQFIDYISMDNVKTMAGYGVYGNEYCGEY